MPAYNCQLLAGLTGAKNGKTVQYERAGFTSLPVHEVK